MANYGDSRLNLPADWNRNTVFNRPFVHMTIGHNNGISEVRLKDKPDQRHAFAWVDPERREEVDYNTDDGYKFVTEKEWTSDRYEWRADGRLYCQGQVLMAMPKEKFDALEEERNRYRPTVDNDKLRAEAEEIAARNKASIYVPDGYEQNRKGVARSRS